jgi:GrpB-like predicted nucleotidyltransferase (UPF0157 family)
MDSAAGAPLVIAAYDPSWPAAFGQERDAILSVIGEKLLAIEHIGSTAVPGLGAKPIIDILAGLAALEDAEQCMQPLAGLGYRFVPEAMRYLPGDRYFRRSVSAKQGTSDVAHLHLTEYASPFWRERIRFRDLLRTSPELARTYEHLKRELAPRYSSGPEYSEAKTEFIRAAVGGA